MKPTPKTEETPPPKLPTSIDELPPETQAWLRAVLAINPLAYEPEDVQATPVATV